MLSGKTLTPNCVCACVCVCVCVTREGGGEGDRESYLIVIVYKIDVFDFNTFHFWTKKVVLSELLLYV